MPRIKAAQLTALVAGIFQARGAAKDTARTIATSLVASNLLGHDSHGVMRVERYVRYIEIGQIKPRARPKRVRQQGAIALVDGRWAFGQLGAGMACEVAAEAARVHGVSAVAVQNVMHIGRLGEYAERLARQGFAALVLTSNGGPVNSVAPYGGRDPLFGTNPMAFSVPMPARSAPLVVDFATSATAEGKLAIAQAAGKNIEAGAIVDNAGRPSIDPNCFYDGGALLPFGAHKGYGIMMMIEILARLMTGYVDSYQSGYQRRPGNTTLVTAWAIDQFSSSREFARQMGKMRAAIKNVRPAAGYHEVLLPGEIEARTKAERLETGISLPNEVWSVLQQLAAARSAAL